MPPTEAPDTVEVKFNKTVTYETEGPGKGPVFEKDATYRFPREFANRWIRRGVAEAVEPQPPMPEATLVKAAPKAEAEGADAPKTGLGVGPGHAHATTSKR